MYSSDQPQLTLAGIVTLVAALSCSPVHATLPQKVKVVMSFGDEAPLPIRPLPSGLCAAPRSGLEALRPPPPSCGLRRPAFSRPHSLCRGGHAGDDYGHNGYDGYEGQDGVYGDDPFDSYGREYGGYKDERPVEGGRAFGPSKAGLGSIPGLDKLVSEEGRGERREVYDFDIFANVSTMPHRLFSVWLRQQAGGLFAGRGWGGADYVGCRALL